MASALKSLARRLLRPQRPMSDTERWLVNLSGTPEYQARVAALQARAELRSITEADEMATIALWVEAHRPALCLEIGTFFAGTSRVIAEALVAGGDHGRLLTIDPYGGHRVPDILAAWPAELRDRVEFRAVNSMTLFDDLETARTPKGGKSPLGMAFVDGNHNFEYALFDIVRAADFLAPGGAIVVDNMDQEGPRQAAARFLQWNPAWRLFAGGRLFDAGLSYADLAPVTWGLLLAPRGLQVSQMAFKFFERGVENRVIAGIKFHAVGASAPGTLAVKLNYHAYPYDYHLTGTGMVQAVRTGTARVRPGEAPVVAFDAPAELALSHAEFNVNYELETLFTPDAGGGYVLLDKDRPFSFE
jgi:predicted O-methyltransferase YrrM